MFPAKIIFGLSAFAATAVILALAFGEDGPRQAGVSQAGTQHGIISSAEAREPAVSRGANPSPANSTAPSALTANDAASTEASKRTVRVVLDSPFGLPGNVVVTTQPAKPPVFAEASPMPPPEAKPILATETISEPVVKPKAKKPPRRQPAELGALYYAPPQPLPPPFFALR